MNAFNINKPSLFGKILKMRRDDKILFNIEKKQTGLNKCLDEQLFLASQTEKK